MKGGIMKDYIIRATDEAGYFRFFIARTSDLANEIRNIHESSATATSAMGRLATMAAMMGADLKGENDQVTLKVNGQGPGGLLVAVADSKGHVRVTADRPQADVPSNPTTNKLDVGSYVGRDGEIAIIKDYGLKNPYSGHSEIVTGEIAEDFAAYFYFSEQTPTVISLGVLVDTDLSVLASGGLFVQVLPDTPEEEIIKLENLVGKLKPISELIEDGMSPEDILREYFSDLNPTILGKQEVVYKCNCSRDRIEQALISVPKDDIREILEEDGQAEVVCHFCNSKYIFDDKDLTKIIND